jgi:hypothetical protein
MGKQKQIESRKHISFPEEKSRKFGEYFKRKTVQQLANNTQIHTLVVQVKGTELLRAEEV